MKTINIPGFCRLWEHFPRHKTFWPLKSEVYAASPTGGAVFFYLRSFTTLLAWPCCGLRERTARSGAGLAPCNQAWVSGAVEQGGWPLQFALVPQASPPSASIKLQAGEFAGWRRPTVPGWIFCTVPGKLSKWFGSTTTVIFPAQKPACKSSCPFSSVSMLTKVGLPSVQSRAIGLPGVRCLILNNWR